jgi:hypothetical protein
LIWRDFNPKSAIPDVAFTTEILASPAKINASLKATPPATMLHFCSIKQIWGEFNLLALRKAQLSVTDS